MLYHTYLREEDGKYKDTYEYMTNSYGDDIINRILEIKDENTRAL